MKNDDAELKAVYSQVLQNCSDRLHKAFTHFFRRVKEKKSGKKVKVGYPRFKKRIKSITFPQKGFSVEDDRLVVSKVGRIPIVIHRPIEGVVKTVTIKRRPSGEWSAVFSCNVETPTIVPAHPDKAIGIDMGLENFVTFSDGTKVENPRFLKKAEKVLKRRQRELSRKVKGSKNREKARLKVARAHEWVLNQRKDFSHKVSTYLTRNYGTIAIEDLNIKGMVNNRALAKSINDAGWGQFLNMLVYKAEKAGGRVVKRGPFEPTTRTCSRCGATRDMKLEDRTYKCDKCGLVIDRDQNAAINVLKGHTSGHGGINACGDGTSTPVSERDASPVVEAGTKCGSARHGSTAGSLPL